MIPIPRPAPHAADRTAPPPAPGSAHRTDDPAPAPSRRAVLRGGAALTLAGGAGALAGGALTPAEQAAAAGTIDLDVLYIGAHPDDEAWALAAFGQWNEVHDQEAGVITVTRGEGGGNAVGLEEGPELGVIREAEERTAVGIAGIRHVFNLDAVDFWYTLSAPLTQQVWGEKAVLGRIIRVVRATRPDVIVTMNPSAVEGNHGNHQQAARFALEAYLMAGREDVFPEHFEEGLKPFTPARVLRSGSDGSGGTGPDAVAKGFAPTVASDVVYGAWNGTWSQKHGTRWSAQLDRSIHAYATQGWTVNDPSPIDPAKIPVAWFTLLDSRAPLADPTRGDDAALRGASLPSHRGGLPEGTRLEITAERFDVVPGVPVTVEVIARAGRSALPRARVDVDVPEGWTVRGDSSLGTVAAHRSATARLTVTPAKDAATGEAVQIRAALRCRRGEGHNVLPLRTAGPVRAGLAPRSEIAQFLDWTEDLGMQRLNALVPTQRTLGSGLTSTWDLEVENLSDQARSADVELTLPDGITADPSRVHVDEVPAGRTTTVQVSVENTDDSLPTANRAPHGGIYPVTASATSDDITHTQQQGLVLVPRLVAKPSDGGDVDGRRGDGEYPGDPIDIGTLWEGAEVSGKDASGSTWVTFDDEALHVFVHVVDDTEGTVLPTNDNKQRFRTDSVEIMIDPRGTSESTASTFILGILPDTLDADGDSAGVAAGRDHDQHQGSLEATAPGVKVASHVSDPYTGYDLEVTIPFTALPDGIDPEHIGFDVVAYDSDTQDRTGQSRIGWSTFPGVQADPYRWGILQLPGASEGEEAPQDPVIPNTAARSVQSPQSIIQSADSGVGLGGRPSLGRSALRIRESHRSTSHVRARIRSRRGGTLRVYAWDGTSVIGSADPVDVQPGTTTSVSVTLEKSAGASGADGGSPSGRRLVLAASLEDADGATAAATTTI
ncbi:GlcNAc-PI de-N-acetylase [Brachybacterium endophyticum]|uniref:GlcNAc-PI de-N-acetylase n=1 Tax=Brachybacterium endophyticum TaxID=2182385 RepID=A0A2U2RJX5_9MICO|nr:sugar-binding protein [Brachybacterium endophyticum]PWH06105.1 GlcNAc-PI de-N-acetylase [Brachybacterium endophyticum]